MSKWLMWYLRKIKVLGVMFTLTYGDFEGKGDINRFVVRLKRLLGVKKLKYLWVREFTVLGEVHYHFFLMGYTFVPYEVVDKAWGLGWVWVSGRDEPVTMKYLMKYLSKDSRFKVIISYALRDDYRDEYIRWSRFKKFNMFYLIYLKNMLNKGLPCALWIFGEFWRDLRSRYDILKDSLWYEFLRFMRFQGVFVVSP